MIEGADLGVRPAGFHALDSLRCEKGYRHWGDDITPGDTPYEAGLGFAVALDKRDPRWRGGPSPTKGGRRPSHLMHFRLTAGEQLLYGGEPIIFAGQCVGYLTSVSYGFTVGAAVGMGYVNRSLPEICEMLAREDGFGLEIAATLFAAEASLRPYYDPLGVRTKL